ncbi:hypothetical protein [Peribacillus asahii]
MKKLIITCMTVVLCFIGFLISTNEASADMKLYFPSSQVNAFVNC